MKRLLLCIVAVLGVAASIFGGYYFYVNNDLQETEVGQNQLQEEKEDMPEATDEGIQMLYRGGALREEDGSINPSGLADAISQRDNYLALHMPPDGFGDKGNRLPGVPNNWLPRGPQNIGGRMKKAIVLDPEFETNGIVYAASATGGVWKSSDRGNSWNAMNNGLQNFGVASLAMDPSNSKILYAGTGEAFHAGLRGGGVFKSTDSGMTWVRLRETWDHKWTYVNDIAVSPDGSKILAAIEGGEGSGPTAHRGVMLSTNGGDTWTKKIDVSIATSVKFDPNSSLRAVASTIDVASNKCKAYYSSTGGQSWSQSLLEQHPVTPGPSPTPRPFDSNGTSQTIHFAFQKSAPGSGPSAVYAQYGNAIGANNRTVMSRSMDGGANFSTYSLTGVPFGISQGVPAFWVSPAVPPADPTDPTVVITGGAFLYRSIDGAQTFERTTDS